MFVGAKSSLPPADVVRLLTVPGQMDMKIGSSDRVDRIFELGQQGLKFAYTQQPPRALPRVEGLTYFQISREAQIEEWNAVGNSLKLGIRLNEGRIVGNIQGQEKLTIRTAGGQAALQLTLFVTKSK
jgi:type VI secretion system protein ImpJ